MGNFITGFKYDHFRNKNRTEYSGTKDNLLTGHRQEEIPHVGISAAACRKKSHAWEFSLQPAGRNPTCGNFRCNLQEEIPCVGISAATCRKKSHAWEFSLQPAGRNPTRGNFRCNLQEEIPHMGFSANSHGKKSGHIMLLFISSYIFSIKLK
jgi:hypothetical protein